MLYADSDGNIGYQLAGRVPIRRGDCPDLPKPGWTGEFEWDGTIPYEELPRLVNPPEGFIVTANNRIVGDDYPHHITSEWMTGYRARRIEELLGERERHSLADFERMQHDFYSFPGDRDRPPALAPAPPRQREVRAIERLKSWDGNLDPRHDRGHDLPRVHGRVRGGGRARRGRRTSARRALPEQVGRRACSRSSPRRWRFQARMLELWDEGDPAWFASSERPEGAPGTTSRWRRSSSARRPRGALRPRSGPVALGPRPRRRVRAPVRRREPALQADLQPQRRGGRRERDRHPERLPRRRTRSRACGDPSTGCWPTSATTGARAGS